MTPDYLLIIIDGLKWLLPIVIGYLIHVLRTQIGLQNQIDQMKLQQEHNSERLTRAEFNFGNVTQQLSQLLVMVARLEERLKKND